MGGKVGLLGRVTQFINCWTSCGEMEPCQGLRLVVEVVVVGFGLGLEKAPGRRAGVRNWSLVFPLIQSRKCCVEV